MKYTKFKSNYDKSPNILVSNDNKILSNITDITQEIKSKITKSDFTIVFECYPGVRYNELKENIISKLKATSVIKMDDYSKDISEIDKLFSENLYSDRVFGYMSDFNINDVYSSTVISKLSKRVSSTKGLNVVYGFGASRIEKYDLLVYLDLTRWEIQKRYRSKELTNWKKSTFSEDILRKYKRSYFIEWRIADKLKEDIYPNIDYYLDTNIKDNAKMITGDDFTYALEKAVKQPFRLVPYFDPGVWGGQWMKEVCNLDKNAVNYAWSFDGVPEENSVNFRFGDSVIQSPALNIVLFKPKNLLGNFVYEKFGKEFPIRFDLLDTIGGQNLSLQVHPTIEYAKENFGINYTQDESYYLLYTEPDSVVYLGLKENIDQTQMKEDLIASNTGTTNFKADKYINKFSAKQHDHFLIPAGTIHCSGAGSMVLEISATPYIFTFKLWDWSRLGKDGLKRPVHLDRGFNVIKWDRTTSWVKNNLVNQSRTIYEDSYVKEEITGLHELQFIETTRYTLKHDYTIKSNNTLNMLNLVGGEKVVLKSTNNSFQDIEIHYAETFILPAGIDEILVEIPKDVEEAILIKATIKEDNKYDWKR